MLYLLFDNYIVDSPNIPVFPSGRRGQVESYIRSSNYTYRSSSKLDITRYTLSTYSYLPFDGAVIRVECQNQQDQELIFESVDNSSWSYVPNRSTTAAEYLRVLTDSFTGNPWIFFAPNNDHPFVGSSPTVVNELLSTAQQLEEEYPDHIVSVYYSMAADLHNMSSPSKGLWGNWDFIFPRQIYEDESCIALKMNKFCGDSIQILRRNDLISLFSRDWHGDKRVIRLEDLTSQFSNAIKHIIVVPKTTICSHFDASFHTDKWPSLERSPAPLFIPDGYFERSIIISYKIHSDVVGHVNIDPSFSRLSYLDSLAPDLNIDATEIPFAWINRIECFNKPMTYSIETSSPQPSYFRKQLLNAWYGYNPLFLTLCSFLRLLSAPLRFIVTRSHRFIYSRFHSLFFYRLIAKLQFFIPFYFNDRKRLSSKYFK